jgi:hypothetical protein
LIGSSAIFTRILYKLLSVSGYDVAHVRALVIRATALLVLDGVGKNGGSSPKPGRSQNRHVLSLACSQIGSYQIRGIEKRGDVPHKVCSGTVGADIRCKKKYVFHLTEDDSLIGIPDAYLVSHKPCYIQL